MKFFRYSLLVGICLKLVGRRPMLDESHPQTHRLKMLLLYHLLTVFCIDRRVLVMGNMPSITWTSDPQISHGWLGSMFIKLFLSLGLLQCMREATFIQGDSFLDLILTSE